MLNLEDIDDVIKWWTWFSVIGFLSIHSQICKDRFEYLSFSASTPIKSHLRVLGLLVFIQISCALLIVAPFILNNKTTGFSTGLFLFAESVGLFLRTLYVISKYTLHLCEINNLAQWKNKATITYYIDFGFEVSVVSINFFLF